MKQVQKRYIYSGIVSGIFFLLSYGILNINIIISLALTALLYLGGILLFKKEDIRELNGTNINNYYFLASKCANLAKRIDDEEITASVNSITTYVDQILVSLTQRPKKVEQVFDFFDYYLDITYKMLYRKNSIKTNGEKNAKDSEFNSKVNEYLKTIVNEFEKQLSNMREAKMLDIENEIKVFEHNIGIKKSDIEVGETNAIK